jgi:hypothetical protein
MNLRQHREWQGQWHNLDGHEYYFFNGADTYAAEPKKAHLPGFWTGSEGLAHPIKDRADTKYVLKSFTIECPERVQRMQWLCAQGLCQCASLPLLRGAPYKFLGAAIMAQVCPFVEGRTWDAWKRQWRTAKDQPQVPLTPDQRLWLAISLAEAVRLLDRGVKLCHSDLSPGNVMIDYRGPRSLPVLSLIDFDAFYHAAVPILPVGKGQTQGTPGYQAPEFVRENQIIRTDLCALAALIHELLAYGEDADSGDPDYGFCDQETLNRRAAAPTSRFRKHWGETIDGLVRRALGARLTSQRPSPDEWCDAFLHLGAAPPPQARLLLTAEAQGRRQRFDLQSSTIDLAQALDSRIALELHRNSLAYEIRCCAPQQCVAVLHDGQSSKSVTLDQQARPLKPGDRIVAAGWELRFDAWEEPAGPEVRQAFQPDTAEESGWKA